MLWQAREHSTHLAAPLGSLLILEEKQGHYVSPRLVLNLQRLSCISVTVLCSHMSYHTRLAEGTDDANSPVKAMIAKVEDCSPVLL